MASVPNLLSIFRIACVPILLMLAWTGATHGFLVLFGLGLLSDVLDGAIARRFALESELGAQLDQWADFALWACLPLAAWWLWPEILRREAAYVVLAIVCLLLPTAIAYAKYREVPGYHTWSAKTSAVLMGVGVPLLLVFDAPWPFRIAALWQLVAAVDELGITLLLAECHHDVPSVFHAARARSTLD
jgi:CDP-diacylglycerol--glycerol-3-phosphate 3-phosphatidyltransferase